MIIYCLNFIKQEDSTVFLSGCKGECLNSGQTNISFSIPSIPVLHRLVSWPDEAAQGHEKMHIQSSFAASFPQVIRRREQAQITCLTALRGSLGGDINWGCIDSVTFGWQHNAETAEPPIPRGMLNPWIQTLLNWMVGDGADRWRFTESKEFLPSLTSTATSGWQPHNL